MRGSYVRGKQSEMNRKLGAKNRKKGKSGIESMQEKSTTLKKDSDTALYSTDL